MFHFFSVIPSMHYKNIGRPMLSTFSDEADKLLVQFSYKYARQNRRAMWFGVARKHLIHMTPEGLET